jgi:hypothetical protein
MSVQLIIPNEDINRGEKSRLGAAQTAVGANLELENSQGLAANGFICVGREGAEQSELKKISSVNADQKNIVLTADTKFVHIKFEEVTKFLYDKRRIYRKLAGASTFTLLTTVDIEVDRPLGTLYEDTAGVDTAQYKATYFNSQTSIETSLDDAKAVYGGGGTHYCDIVEAREEAGFLNNDNIDEDRIYRVRARAEGEINASLIGRYALPLTANVAYSDSPAQEMVRQIAMLLTAGWLLWQEYPDERGKGTSNDGLAKVKEARSMLKDIRNGNLTLLGSDNSPLTQNNTLTIEGYPDNSFSNIPDANHDNDENYIFQLGKSW